MTRTYNNPTDAGVGAARTYFRDLQTTIVNTLEQIEGTAFRTDHWERSEGGGGVSRLQESGRLFERAAVLFSHVMGKSLPRSEERRVGNECVIRVDLGGRRSIKKKKKQ